MSQDATLLPSVDEQDWLLDELATLIRRRGYSTFVAAPVLEPCPQHFPEGSARATARLCAYAGLPELRADAADASFAAAALAVAQAFRRHHELQVDARLEDRLAWLTAAYLGFGVLCMGASGLAPPALAFVLAAQQVVRAPLPEERRRFAARLGPEHAASFEAAHAALARTDLVKRLGLPRSITWPAPRQAVPAPLPDAAAASLPPPPSLPRGRNHGVAVFRLKEDPAGRFAWLGTALGAVASIALVRVLAPPYLLWLVVVAACVGWWLGARRRRDRCSEPECGWTIPAGLTRCLGCDGAVNGRIRHASERLAARARLARRDAARY